MIVLQLRFKDGKEEFVTVDSTEFHPETGRLSIRIGDMGLLVGEDCYAYVYIQGNITKEYTVVGAKAEPKKVE